MAGAVPASSVLRRLEANVSPPQSVLDMIQIPMTALSSPHNQHHHHRQLTSYPNVDFAGFHAGDIVTDLGHGVTVAATQRHRDGTTQTGDAMIFDTTRPTGGDADLGTPNISFGGPGQGKGGKKGKLFENGASQGFSLIISEGNADAVTNPDDNSYGGYLVFTFDPPRHLDSVGLLDNDGKNGVTFTIVTADGGRDIRHNMNGGDNSFERVKIGKPMVCFLIVEFTESGSLTDLDFTNAPSTCSGSRSLLSLDSYDKGDIISNFGDGVTVQTIKRNGDGKVVMANAMVFDSSHPSGGDFDLGTPHGTFGGPGQGKQGKKGKLFENRDPQGNVLIVSEDNDASDPDDNQWEAILAFTFAPPRYIESIGLLDNDQGTSFAIETSDGGASTILNANGGDNSFESVKIGKPQVTMLIVAFGGSGAVTDIVTCD